MIFILKRKVEKGERNDKMARKPKSKAFKSINLNDRHKNGMTHFEIGKKVHVRLLFRLSRVGKSKLSIFMTTSKCHIYQLFEFSRPKLRHGYCSPLCQVSKTF